MTAFFQDAVRRGAQFGQVLIENGRLTPVDLLRALQQNVAKKLLDLFTWREGTFRIGTEPQAVAAPLKVRVPQLVIMGITRFAIQEDVNAAVVPLVGRTLALHPMSPFPLDDIRLGARQAPLLVALREGKRMDELMMACPGLPPEEITRLVYALALLGVVVPAEQVPPGMAPPELPRRLTQPAAHVPEAPVAETQQLDNEVMQAYLAFRGQDSYALLGAPEDATLPQVQERYLAFAEQFRPARFAEAGLPAAAEKARELFLAGAAAYGEIADPERRRELLTRRRALREEVAKRPPPDFTIKTDLLDPEIQYNKGLEHLQAGHYREAIAQLEFAADCDPGNGVYRSELAFCRYRLAPDFAGPQALRDLLEAQRIDPGCGLAAFYTGQVCAALGRIDEAEKNYRKAVKLMAPDRRPIEALKALKK
jgi:hypothetical protein